MLRTAVSAAFPLLLTVALTGCADGESASALAGDDRPLAAAAVSTDEADEGEVEIPLSEVPQHVKDAAAAAVPGLVLEEAERETENGVVVYDLEGEADGLEYEVEVDADGNVLEVEQDEDDDDDGGEDDD